MSLASFQKMRRAEAEKKAKEAKKKAPKKEKQVTYDTKRN